MGPISGYNLKIGMELNITIYKNEHFDISKMEIGSGNDARQYSKGKGYSNPIHFEGFRDSNLVY